MKIENVVDDKCLYCDGKELVQSQVSFAEQRSTLPVSMRRDGQESYINCQYVLFTVIQSVKCGFYSFFSFTRRIK